jgi:hypothetical protein
MGVVMNFYNLLSWYLSGGTEKKNPQETSVNVSASRRKFQLERGASALTGQIS